MSQERKAFVAGLYVGMLAPVFGVYLWFAVWR